MANMLVKVFLTLLFYITAPLLFAFCSAVLLFRFCVSKILSKLESGLGKILTTRSSGAATDKIYVEPKMTLVAISTYEGTIDLATLRREFESRVVFARNEKGLLLRPELRQYITRRYGFSFWKDDPSFTIDQHVKVYDGIFATEFVASEVVTPEMILRASENLLYSGFLLKRSPWELLVFRNYRDSSDSPLSTALALRIHHALGDGFSILNLTKDLLNEVTETSTVRTHEPFLLQLKKLSGFLFLAPFQFISETLDAVDVPSWKVNGIKLKRSYNLGVSPMIPLEKIKEVRRLTKSSFTAVILGCFTGALRRFMTEAGHSVPKQIHCVTPLPMRGHPGRKMRNHMAGCITPLPVGMEDRMQRLRAIDEDLVQIRRSTYPVTLFWFGGLIGGLFRNMTKHFTANNITSAIMSNFPGPEKNMRFNQHTLRSMYFCGGLFRGTCAIGFSALSCSGNVRFVFGIDESVVACDTLQASLLVDYFLEELELLRTFDTVGINNHKINIEN